MNTPQNTTDQQATTQPNHGQPTSETEVTNKPHHCQELRKDGEPCKGYATANGKCAGHNKYGATANPKANQAKSARIRTEKAEARKLTLLDHMAAEIEAKAKQIVGDMLAAGEGGDWRAYESLITRVHGRPTERVESVGTTGNVGDLSKADRARLRAELLADRPELRVLTGGPDVDSGDNKQVV